MSISEIKSCSHAIHTQKNLTQENANSKEAGYHLIRTNMNFLGKPFTDRMPFLQRLIAPAPVNVYCYSDVEKLTKEFNLFRNGFQYIKLKEGSFLLDAIKQYVKAHPNLIEEESQLSSRVEQFLFSWGEENGIPGIPVVVNNVYRSSDRSDGGASPFSFVHVDFSKEEVTNPFSPGGKMYKEGMERKFNKMISNEEYKKIKHSVQVNVWIPLHDKPSNNTLAVMDTNSVHDLPQKMRPISISDAIGFSLHANQGEKWVVKENLTLRDRLIIVFLTTSTFHTAINLEDESGVPKSPRRSIEFRADFIF